MIQPAELQACVERMNGVVKHASNHLAGLTDKNGRISTELLDQHQDAVYQLAFLGAEAAMATRMVEYAAFGAHECLIAGIALADLVRSTRTRLDGRRQLLGVNDDLRGGACDSVLTGGLDPDRIDTLVGSMETSNTGPPHLSEDVALVADTFSRFARRAEETHRRNLDVPDDLIESMGAIGAFGMSIPTNFGGFQDPAGAGLLAMAVATEALSQGSLMAGSLLTRPGTDEQKRGWLPGIASGERMVAVSVTEPDVGSDVASLRMSARRRGDRFVMNGAKMWATFAGRAELLMILARTDPRSPDTNSASDNPGEALCAAGQSTHLDIGVYTALS
jgi:(2S)-methylsuccinyl-CoA dehydrogenase